MSLPESNSSYYSRLYHIIVNQKNIAGKMTVTVDGALQIDNVVNLSDNGVEHSVEVDLFF